MRVVVTSGKDIAGSNVFDILAKSPGFTKIDKFEGVPVYKKGDITLISTEKSQVEAEHLDSYFSPAYYVFASRHRSASGEKTLTVHPPGNLTEEAIVGGRPRELAYAAADAMKVALLELENEKKEKNLDYKISLEVTHHGPTTLKKPVVFVEVGSTEDEWNDMAAVEAVANAALRAAENKNTFEKGVGIGGNHYAARHTRFVRESDASLGHLIPSYSLESVNLEVLSSAIEKSSATFLFLDWKGMKKEQRERLLLMAQEIDIEVRRSISKDKKSVTADYTTFRIHKAVFILAEKYDSSRLRQVITQNKGMPTESNGHLLPEFSAQNDIRALVLEACIDILKPKNPTLSERALVLDDERFDPKKAEELGLKPGPDFATLKRGESVKVDNCSIQLSDVVVKKKIMILLDDETLKILKSFI